MCVRMIPKHTVSFILCFNHHADDGNVSMRSRSSVLEIDAFKIQRKFIKAGDFGELVLQRNFAVSNIVTVKRNF